MKKSMIGIFVLIFYLSGVFAQDINCTDSDGGLNYSSKGVVTGFGLEIPGVESTFEDYCGVAGEEEEALVEYTCNSKNNVEKNIYSCPNDCIDGVCMDPMISETITCLFGDTSDENICYDRFHDANVETITEEIERKDGQGIYKTELQYNCEGKGQCLITVKGRADGRIKWGSSCLEKVSDAKIKPFAELIINPKYTTVMDGINKTIKFECIDNSILSFILGSFRKLRETLLKMRYGDRLGFRAGYILCGEGTEIISNNEAPFCKTQKDLFEELEGRCSADLTKRGRTMFLYNGCDLKNPYKDIEIVNM